MKITPVGVPSLDIGVNPGAGPDRLENAKAIARGESPMRQAPSDTPVDPQVARIQKRKIKMTTQVSPNREIEEPASDLVAEVQTQNATQDVSEQDEVVEATKPLSPQFAALAKQRRALQQERAAFEREKAESQSANGASNSGGVDLARLKSDPLSVLDEVGVLNDDSFYNSLTDRLLKGQTNPAASQIAALEAKIKALETGFDSKLTERDSHAENQVVAEIKREAQAMVQSSDEYKYTRAMGKADDASRLIHENWKKTGEVWDTDYALGLIEAECKKDYEALQTRLGLAQSQPAMAASQPQKPGMRTLTNRDTAKPSPSRRDRMIAAFEGRLK